MEERDRERDDDRKKGERLGRRKGKGEDRKIVERKRKGWEDEKERKRKGK